MKFSDMLKFSASYLKKHKARFLITTVYSFLLILLIFVIIYSAFSVVATARRDVEEYAHQSGNVARVSLSNLIVYSESDGDYHHFTTREEIDAVQKQLEKKGETNVQIVESRHEAQFMGMRISPRTMNEDVTVLQGQGLDEAGENSIWITEYAARLLQKVGMGVGSVVMVNSAYESGAFTIVGIVGGEGEAYARESDLIRMGFLQFNVIYSVQLASGSYAEVGELDGIISQTNDNIETYEDKDRLSCALTSHYEGINLLSGIFAAALAVAAAFCTLLLLSVLRNNSVIGIYDNIGFYAMLTCMGIKRRDVNIIAVLETLVCVIISAFAAMGISVLLGGASAGIAGAMLSEFLAATSGGVFAWAWWVDILYIAALAAFVVIYFVLTLQKVLAKRNLLSVLRSEL